MISATTCIYQGAEIHVDEAIRIRDVNNGVPRGDFTCIECAQAVKPHNANERTNHPAHIEHFEVNPACTYSVGESAVNRPDDEPESETYEVEDPRAIEGHDQDRKIIAKSRNPKIAIQRKELDNYTCQACNLRLEINGRFIIECHHLNPVSVAGITEISLNDLVSLCPTCHRVSHTRREPFNVIDIKKMLGLADD